MNNKISNSISVFEDNFKAARKSYLFSTSLEACGCASAFIGDTRPVSVENLKAARKILRNSTGIFSMLGHGNASLVVAATIARSNNFEYAMDRIAYIHRLLDNKFFNSDYLVLAATIIYNNCDPSQYEAVTTKVRQVFKLIRKDHPLITDREDIANCTVMALSDRSPEEIAARCEEDFKALKSYYHLKGKIQKMACITCLSDGKSDEKARAVRTTHDLMKEHGICFSYDNAYSIVASIATLVPKADQERVICDIVETGNELKRIRGMGAMGVGKRMRTLVACAIVMDAYLQDSNNAIASSLNSAIISALIAVEIAIIIAITCSSAAAASSASS